MYLMAAAVKVKGFHKTLHRKTIVVKRRPFATPLNTSDGYNTVSPYSKLTDLVLL